MADDPLRQSGIYCIRNLVSRRVYVGSAVNIKQRWRKHRERLRSGNHHSKVFQRSWDKHGETAFAFEVLEIVSARSKLIVREQFWIDDLRAAHPKRGLNSSPTAGSTLGIKLSAETRARFSVQRKGRKIPPFSLEHRANIARARKGKLASDKTRLKMSADRRGKKRPPFSQQWKANIAAAKQNVSEETRAKLSAARRAHELKRNRQIELPF